MFEKYQVHALFCNGQIITFRQITKDIRIVIFGGPNFLDIENDISIIKYHK